MKKVLLGLTTTGGSSIKEKIEEIKEFNLKEIALFLTGINQKKRRELYSALEETPLKEIPHVHLRNDMEKWELEYLESRFEVSAYNIHGQKSSFPFSGCGEILKSYGNKIYIENTEFVPDQEEMKKVGGLCVDFSHWQDAILLNWEKYDHKLRTSAKEFPVGCSHVSAVGKFAGDSFTGEGYSKHRFDDISELDYMKNFINYLPDLISLELENSFKEQMKVKDYLRKQLDLF
ncbi:MAG: hypothetical protein R6V40_01400 [Candidatus Moraniibacteriota bacterium]